MSKLNQLRRALAILTEGGSRSGSRKQRRIAEDTALEHRHWLRGEGVQGIGVARRIRGNEETKELVLTVYVDRKRARGEVQHLVPPAIRIPGVAEEVRTDVEEIGPLQLEMNTSSIRPAVPGYSLGTPTGIAGTLGCLVRKVNDPHRTYLLSNAHVIAGLGQAPIGTEIIQPAREDGGGQPRDVVAFLSEVAAPVTGDNFPNRVDAAIAEVVDGLVTSRIRLLGTPTGFSSSLRRDMFVQKVGRTSDHTQASIRDTSFRCEFDVDFPDGRRERIGFRDQVLCKSFTQGGDSGAAVLNLSGQVVGLHLAGSAGSSVFTPIRFVMRALGIDVITEVF